MNAKDGLDGGRARRGPRVPPAVMRRGVRLIGRRCLDPALPWPAQRSRLERCRLERCRLALAARAGR